MLVLWTGLFVVSGTVVLQLFLKKGLVVKESDWGKAFQVVVLECLGGLLLVLANFWWPVWLVILFWLFLVFVVCLMFC